MKRDRGYQTAARVAAVAFVAVTTAVSAQAETAQVVAPTPAPEQVDAATPVELAPVEVRGTVLSTDVGRVKLNRDDVLRLQDGNGDLNRLLRNLPNVQFGEDLSDARKLGEIVPAKVSISGGRSYENRFLVDGISVNSVLDPAAETPVNAVNDAPGHAQSLFIDTDLVESLEVYDANAPASIGGFTGGVIKANTRRAGRHFGFSGFVSGTSDAMVHFKVFEPPQDPDDPEDIVFARKPEFRKLRLGLTGDIPLSDDAGLLLSVTRLTSRIPVLSLAEFLTERRENTNLMGKLHGRIGDTDLQAVLTHAPYQSDNLIADVLDSRFTVTGGGTSLGLTADRATAFGNITLGLDHSRSENARRGPKDFLTWITSSNGPDWGERIFSLNSSEGGFGDIDKTQQQSTLAAELQRPLGPGTLQTGVTVEHLNAGFERDQDTYVYSSGEVDSRIRCVGDNVPACISGNQALFTRSVYPQDRVSVDLVQAAVFAQWQYEAAQWSARLGLRLDGDDFQHNLNLAPRSLFTWEPLSFLGVHLGANRYYSRSLLTFRLREASKPFFSEYREATGGTVGGNPVKLVQDQWITTVAAGNVVYSGTVADLETPYSDELSLGVTTQGWGISAGLRGSYRKFEKEFSQFRSPEDPDTGLVTLSPTNNGEGEYRSLVLALSRGFGAWLQLGMNVTWSETQRSNEAYDSRSGSELEDQLVIYNDAVVVLGDLSRVATDFARPLNFNLTADLALAPRLDLTLTGRYRGRYRNVEDTGLDDTRIISRCPGCEPRREELSIYGVVTRPAGVLFDAKLRYQQPLAGRQTLELELLLDNVFNQRTYTASGVNVYEAGTSAWMLMRYRYGSTR